MTGKQRNNHNKMKKQEGKVFYAKTAQKACDKDRSGRNYIDISSTARVTQQKRITNLISTTHLPTVKACLGTDITLLKKTMNREKKKGIS